MIYCGQTTGCEQMYYNHQNTIIKLLWLVLHGYLLGGREVIGFQSPGNTLSGKLIMIWLPRPQTHNNCKIGRTLVMIQKLKNASDPLCGIP